MLVFVYHLLIASCRERNDILDMGKQLQNVHVEQERVRRDAERMKRATESMLLSTDEIEYVVLRFGWLSRYWVSVTL